MSDYYRCTCGNHLEKVTQSANSMLNSEQFDAARMGDWFCRRCPTNEGKNRYFWDSDIAALAAVPAPPAPSAALAFQQRVQPWMLECFGAEIAADRIDRNHRFMEESLELVQSLGCTASEAHLLVDYVFGRPVGDPPQEVGGVMVTLAALCLASGLDMHDAGEVELARISVPVLMAKIRAKQAAKPKYSPLPQSLTPQADSQPAPVLDMAVMQLAESVGLIGPASRVHDLHAAIQRFHDLICVNATIKAAVSGAATSARDYPPLPMQFACSGVFPVYSADQMRAYVDADRAACAPADSVTAPAGVVGPDGMMRDELRSMIEGMSVSVDVSTGDHDAGYRYFGTVTEVMGCRDDKHGVTLLVQDAEPNFSPTPPAQAADSVLEDAARYLFLRDGKWRDTDLEPVIRLQLNSLWDVKIDAAIAAQQGDSHE